MPASRFTRTTVSLSVRTEERGLHRADVPGLAVVGCEEITVTRSYQIPRGCWNVTHAPTGLTLTARGFGTARAAKALALAVADALITADVRVDTDNPEKAVNRFSSVPAAMAAIQAVR